MAVRDLEIQMDHSASERSTTSLPCEGMAQGDKALCAVLCFQSRSVLAVTMGDVA
jgi:hypothetical protein